jgi:hypothetical protein
MPLLAAFRRFVFVAIAVAIFAGSLPPLSKFSFVMETLPVLNEEDPKARFCEPPNSSCSN